MFGSKLLTSVCLVASLAASVFAAPVASPDAPTSTVRSTLPAPSPVPSACGVGSVKRDVPVPRANTKEAAARRDAAAARPSPLPPLVGDLVLRDKTGKKVDLRFWFTFGPPNVRFIPGDGEWGQIVFTDNNIADQGEHLGLFARDSQFPEDYIKPGSFAYAQFFGSWDHDDITGYRVDYSVWSYNPRTKQIIPHWRNSDGSKYPLHTMLLYASTRDSPYTYAFTADVDAFKATWDQFGPSDELSIFLE
ncbi:hypothetical protein FRB99_006107 [Tulasnella sp. 403]|nr:hypothetical protein FRB99_006107 [Tulasnella sp. 403]